MSLTKEDAEYLRSLRKRGFGVIIWTPDELERADLSQEDMEDTCIQTGNDLIFLREKQRNDNNHG